MGATPLLIVDCSLLTEWHDARLASAARQVNVGGMMSNATPG